MELELHGSEATVGRVVILQSGSCDFLLPDLDVPLGEALNPKLPTGLCMGV